jgi:hypothetical protein
MHYLRFGATAVDAGMSDLKCYAWLGAYMDGWQQLGCSVNMISRSPHFHHSACYGWRNKTQILLAKGPKIAAMNSKVMDNADNQASA